MCRIEKIWSKLQFFNKIIGITAQSPNEFIVTIKKKKAIELLTNLSEFCISDIRYTLGFNLPKYFSKCFKVQFGISSSGSNRKTEDNSTEEEKVEE